MKTLVALLFVLAFVPIASQAQQPCLKLSKVKVQDKLLHQNGISQVELIFEANHCFVFGGSPQQRQRPVVEIQGEPGLNVQVSSYGESRFDQVALAFGIVGSQEVSATLNVNALAGLDLGEHKLPGQIRYQVMDLSGNVSDKTLAFEVTLKVAPPQKMAVPARPFSEQHPVWAKVLLPLEIVAFIPAFILAGLMGWDGC